MTLFFTLLHLSLVFSLIFFPFTQITAELLQHYIGIYTPITLTLVVCSCLFQSLRMYILGEEAMVPNPQGFVAGGHVARSTSGHLANRWHRHSSYHCGNTNLHGPQGME